MVEAMTGGVFLLQNDGSLVEMREKPYESEALLQGLLQRYPNLLAGDQVDSDNPRQWLLINREVTLPSEDAGAPRWSVDHLFLDQDAIPTIIEVKRSSDARIRREVVGQMLDYAANGVVYWSIEALRAKFDARCATESVDPDEELQRVLNQADPEAFWQHAKTNLQAGRVRLVFVADVIPKELRRIVEFLNEQMDPAEVLAIEIRQFEGQGLKTLIPTVIGQTAEAQQRKGFSSPEKRQWDEASVFELLEERRGAGAVRVARELLNWAISRGARILWGRGQIDGSFVPVIQHNAVAHQLFAVYTTGSLEIYFQFYRTRPPFDNEVLRKELLDRYRAAAGVVIPDDAINRRPSLPLTTFEDSAKLEKLLALLDWVVAQIRST